MLKIIIVAIVFGSIIALATLICGTILIIIKTRTNRSSSGATDSEEARTIQEIYQGLEKLEERIDSLETILAEDQEKDGYRK
jgi:phage shock protein B